MGGTEVRIPRVQPYGSVSGPRADWLYVVDTSVRPTNTVLTANRTYYIRRSTPSVPISQVQIVIGVSSGNLCISAYAHNPATNQPGARLATSGSIASPGTAARTISLGATVTPEWLSIAADNGTLTVAAASGTIDLFTGAEGRVAIQDSAFPSPNPAVPTSFATGGAYILVGKP